MEEDMVNNVRTKNAHRALVGQHYYGDILRRVFMAMAIIMLVATPFFKDRLPLPEIVSIIGVLALSLGAGLTNPKWRLIIIFDFIISLVLVPTFGYEVIIAYGEHPNDLFFWCNLVLAVLAVFALYLSSKTLRGNYFPG